jgi:hypothetical protein
MPPNRHLVSILSGDFHYEILVKSKNNMTLPAAIQDFYAISEEDQFSSKPGSAQGTDKQRLSEQGGQRDKGVLSLTEQDQPPGNDASSSTGQDSPLGVAPSSRLEKDCVSSW